MADQLAEAQRWLGEFQQDSSNEIIKNLGLLLGEELKVRMQEYSIIERDRTLPLFALPICNSTLDISKSYSGNGILIFQKRTAILLSGILSMYNKDVLDDKLKTLDMDESDMDAFGEICNQLIGSVDRITTDLLPDKVHIKQSGTSVWERKKEMEFPFEDEYLVVFPYAAESGDHETIRFHLMFPVSAIEKFLEVQIDWESIYKNQQVELEIPKEPEEEVFEEIQSLFIRLSSGCDSQMQTLFEKNSVLYSFVDTYKALQEQILQNSIKLIVLQVEGQERQGVALCNKIIKDLEGYHIPIWLQGRNWDKTLVNKARKAGASYLTISPINPNTLEPKIQETFGLQ